MKKIYIHFQKHLKMSFLFGILLISMACQKKDDSSPVNPRLNLVGVRFGQPTSGHWTQTRGQFTPGGGMDVSNFSTVFKLLTNQVYGAEDVVGNVKLDGASFEGYVEFDARGQVKVSENSFLRVYLEDERVAEEGIVAFDLPVLSGMYTELNSYVQISFGNPNTKAAILSMRGGVNMSTGNFEGQVDLLGSVITFRVPACGFFLCH